MISEVSQVKEDLENRSFRDARCDNCDIYGTSTPMHDFMGYFTIMLHSVAKIHDSLNGKFSVEHMRGGERVTNTNNPTGFRTSLIGEWRTMYIRLYYTLSSILNTLPCLLFLNRIS